jgi:OmcA/MtrC family decaheme c-type cytochrome
MSYCVVCHSPMVTDSSMRAKGDTHESINFKSMIHKIHTGDNLADDFTIMGHGNTPNNFNEVGYPGDRRNCLGCHVAGTYNLPLPDGLLSQMAPRDYLNPMPLVTGACLSSCHGTASTGSIVNVHAR